MPHTIELKTRVLAGHRIEICSPELPEGQAATVQVTFDQPDASVLGVCSQELQAAERGYLRDLPQLLRSHPGRWVGYSPQGLIAEGDDELAVFHACGQQGLRRGEAARELSEEFRGTAVAGRDGAAREHQRERERGNRDNTVRHLSHSAWQILRSGNYAFAARALHSI